VNEGLELLLGERGSGIRKRDRSEAAAEIAAKRGRDERSLGCEHSPHRDTLRDVEIRHRGDALDDERELGDRPELANSARGWLARPDDDGDAGVVNENETAPRGN